MGMAIGIAPPSMCESSVIMLVKTSPLDGSCYRTSNAQNPIRVLSVHPSALPSTGRTLLAQWSVATPEF